jgi:hypothetical protein
MQNGSLRQQSVLCSWKEIAAHTGKGVRTLQRWEREHGLPVRRPRKTQGVKSAVMINVDDLNTWLSENFVAHVPAAPKVPMTRIHPTLQGYLHCPMTENSDWIAANEQFMDEVSAATQSLASQCDHLLELWLEVSWKLVASKRSV